MQKTTALLGDLTAVFSARSRYRKSINYERLNTNLKQKLEVETWDDTQLFTLFKADNEKQTSFVNTLKEIGWNVCTEAQRNVRRVDDPRFYRFDARMSAEIVLSESDRVVVMSDSFELFPVVQQLHDMSPDVEVVLAFFADAVDTRWWKEINKNDSYITFVDLDELI
jgi:hypothetical protein